MDLASNLALMLHVPNEYIHESFLFLELDS